DLVTFESTCSVEKAKKLKLINKKKILFWPLASPFEFKIKHEDHERENTILCVARLVRCKGQNVLIKAFSLIKDEAPNWKLILAGPAIDNKYMNELVDLIKREGLDKRVLLVGGVHNELLYKLYKKSSIFVLPSINTESAGQVKYEATAFGLPVLTTDVPCAMDNLKNGWIVAKAGDHIELADKLRYLICSKEARIKQVELAQKTLKTYKESVMDLISILNSNKP
ncbi:MAG: glycosyltransferase, partial [Caldisphaera sp.]